MQYWTASAPRPRRSVAAECSSPATRPTSCRRQGASGATPAWPMPTTWRGSSPWCTAASPARDCSTATTRNDARSPISRWSRPTPATSCASTHRCPRRISKKPSTTRRSSSGRLSRPRPSEARSCPIRRSRTRGTGAGASGRAVPHRWLDEDRSVSTVDLASDGFALVVPPGHAGYDQAVRQIEAGTGLRLTLHHVADGSDMDLPGAVLIRPDAVIAWASADAESGAASLPDALASLLSTPAHMAARG